MNLQEKMFGDIESWFESGQTKQNFLKDKAYSLAKFNYWLKKFKDSQEPTTLEGFKELGFSESSLGKVLEIETPSGLKIIVFA
jgi:hypothetical protein